MDKKIWQQKEKDDAKDFGGSLQVGSGRTWKNKADVKTEEYLIEAKTTEKKSFSVSKKLWDKIRKAAIHEGRTPLLSIRLLPSTDLIVIDKNDFLSLTEYNKML